MITITLFDHDHYQAITADVHDKTVNLYEDVGGGAFVWIGDIKRKVFEECLSRGIFKRLS